MPKEIAVVHHADRRRDVHMPYAPAIVVRRGDLVFFDQGWKKNGHVGIYLGAGEFIHAPSSGGRVRKDSLQSPYWRKHLSEARRIAV